MRLLLWLSWAAVAAGAEAACEEDSSQPVASIIASIRRGDYECAVSTAKATEGKLENAIALELRSIEASLKQIKEAARPSSSSAIAPAHQWAQSGTEIFISVKFAHKWDAPATLVNGDDVALVDFKERSVTVKAEKSRKEFLLQLELLRDVEPANCTWQSASVGRATLTLRKKEREWWPRLIAAKNKPPNQHVWWDKQETFEDEREAVQEEERQKAKKDKAKETEKKTAESPKVDDATTKPTTKEVVEEDPAELAAKAEAKKRAKVAASRKKKAEEEARQQKKLINEETKKRIAKIDEDLKKKKEAIDKQVAAGTIDVVEAPNDVESEGELGGEAVLPAGKPPPAEL